MEELICLLYHLPEPLGMNGDVSRLLQEKYKKKDDTDPIFLRKFNFYSLQRPTKDTMHLWIVDEKRNI